MPTNNTKKDLNLINEPLSLKELTEVLIKHYDIHEGLHDLVLEFQVGIGQIGADPESRLPGAMVTISKIGLIKSESVGQATADASVVNPAKRKRKKSDE